MLPLPFLPSTILALPTLLALLATAHPTPASNASLLARSCNDPIHGPVPTSAIGESTADIGLPLEHRGTEQIRWGNVANPLALCDGMHNNGRLPDPVCFGGHGVSNTFMDHAVAIFCAAADGLILNLNNPNNSVAMTYTYWPPSVAPNNDRWDGCTESGQVYMHIGFGLGASNKTAYTLSRQSCVRGLGQVYNMGVVGLMGSFYGADADGGDSCDNSHKDNKHGGQLDLGSFDGHKMDPSFNDNLFYLIDPAPPAQGRSLYYTDYQRFVPNPEDTNTLDDFIDPCYWAHEGYGGLDKWSVDPSAWKGDHEAGKRKHEDAKKFCSTHDGVYDNDKGIWGNY